MSWLAEYSESAAKTDRLLDHKNHADILLVGLFGEAGSVLAEFKKQIREGDSYPYYKNRLEEEIGDFLWYFVRYLKISSHKEILQMLSIDEPDTAPLMTKEESYLKFGSNVSELLIAATNKDYAAEQEICLRIWSLLRSITTTSGVNLRMATMNNLAKAESRWPSKKNVHERFDENVPVYEQLPRKLRVEFRELGVGKEKKSVILRCNDLNFGARLTDNIQSGDFYRFHDIFHFSYMVFIGWSPVIRSLLNCKRKSIPEKDENQDGARAAIIEEAISATVFSYAKHMHFLEGITAIDYGILKLVKDFSLGFEVDTISLWQWEEAILTGFEIFRKLRDNAGGTVELDMLDRSMVFKPPGNQSIFPFSQSEQ